MSSRKRKPDEIPPPPGGWSRSVSCHDLETMLIFSFRYALGRQSTAPGTVATLIRQYADVIEPWRRIQILSDIDRAVSRDGAGMDCDRALWLDLADWLRTRFPGDPK